MLTSFVCTASSRCARAVAGGADVEDVGVWKEGASLGQWTRTWNTKRPYVRILATCASDGGISALRIRCSRELVLFATTKRAGFRQSPEHSPEYREECSCGTKFICIIVCSYNGAGTVIIDDPPSRHH